MIKRDLTKYRYNYSALEVLFQGLARQGYILKEFKGDKAYFGVQNPIEKNYRIIYRDKYQDFANKSCWCKSLNVVCQNKKYGFYVIEYHAAEAELIAGGIEECSIKKRAIVQTLREVLGTFISCVLAYIVILGLWKGLSWFNAGIGAWYTLTFLLVLLGVLIIGGIHMASTVVGNSLAYQKKGPFFIKDVSRVGDSRKILNRNLITMVLSGILILSCIGTLFSKTQFYYNNSLPEESSPVTDVSQFLQTPRAYNITGNEVYSLVSKNRELLTLDQTITVHQSGQMKKEIPYSIDYFCSSNSLELRVFYHILKNEIDSDYLEKDSCTAFNQPGVSGIYYMEDGYFLSLMKTEKSVMMILINATERNDVISAQALNRSIFLQRNFETLEIQKLR